jgi:hypothetical protein
MNYSDETLMMYADGELAPDARAAVAAAAAVDPEVAKRIAGFNAQREALVRAYAPMLAEPVPARLAEIVTRSESKVVDLRARPVGGARRLRTWAWPEWAAIAASLVVGILVAHFATLERKPDVLVAGPQGLMAGRALADTLSRRLASDQSPDAAMRIGLSYENTAGQLCRTFDTRGGTAMSGIACFSDGAWRVAMLVPDAHSPSAATDGSVRMAAAQWPPAVLREVQDHIRGEPLDAAGERAARDRGWRP